jgi:hypothetical protein
MNRLTLGLAVLLLAAGAASGQWEPEIRLTESDSASEVPEFVGRNLAADGQYVHLVWLEDEGPGYYPQTWYIRSTNQGLSWGEPISVCSDTFYNGAASVVASDGYVHVFWADVRDGNGSDVYYSRSTDNGTTWSANRRLTTATGTSFEPNSAVEGGYVHLVWTDRPVSPSQIYYKRSPDRGFSWTQDVAISMLDSGASRPTVAVADSIVQVAYAGQHGDGPEVHYVRSLDNGLTWEPDIVLTNSTAPNGQVTPHIAVSGPTVHVVYTDRSSGNDEAFYLRSPDYGLSWGPACSLFSTPGDDVGRTVVAASGLNVHAATHLRIDSRNWIHYRRSTDDGLTWEPREIVSDSGWAFYASIATAGTGVHLVWQDGRDGNSEIYYRRDPTGNPGVGETPGAGVRTPNARPSIIRGVLRLPWAMGAGHDPIPLGESGSCPKPVLLDVSGRKAMVIQPGPNDVSRLAPGVYFLREDQAQSVRKIAIAE